MEGSSVTRPSGIYSPDIVEDIQVKAELGRYRIRGFGTLRQRPLPSLDDLTFLPCTLTRIPLEGYRERCSTRTVLGSRFAARSHFALRNRFGRRCGRRAYAADKAADRHDQGSGHFCASRG